MKMLRPALDLMPGIEHALDGFVLDYICHYVGESGGGRYGRRA